MKLEKGQIQSVSFTAYDSDGTVRDLTADTVTLYIYRDLEGTALATKVATVAAPTTGVFVFEFIAADTSSLDKSYYPVKILINDGTYNEIYDTGILNILTPTNRWEFDIDKLTGVTLSEMRAKVKLNIKHDSWSTAKLNKWINDALEDICLETEYNKVKMSSETRYGKNEYILPDLLIEIDKIDYVDSNDEVKVLVKNRDWIRKGSKLIFGDKAQGLEKSGDELLGGYAFTIHGSAYAQEMANDADYTEFEKGVNKAVEKFVERTLKIEDRRPADEIAIVSANYRAQVNKWILKNEIDSANGYQIILELDGGTALNTDPLNQGDVNV